MDQLITIPLAYKPDQLLPALQHQVLPSSQSPQVGQGQLRPVKKRCDDAPAFNSSCNPSQPEPPGCSKRPGFDFEEEARSVFFEVRQACTRILSAERRTGSSFEM
uniref:Uncharacterized protein n=1 Tax=Heterosigma akashiwo TaxID=2829 RepID=A0A7S3XZY5_HETAK